jgi:hypothetical protein
MNEDDKYFFGDCDGDLDEIERIVAVHEQEKSTPRAELRDDGKRVAISCPGCGFDHEVVIDGSRGWTWNGDFDRPTIKPSILVRWDFGEKREKKVCHSFVTDGRIKFLGDCTHGMAGQTVDLPPVD